MTTTTTTTRRVPLTIRVDIDTHKRARRRMIDDDLTFQNLCVAAIEAYVSGAWSPPLYDAAVEDRERS